MRALSTLYAAVLYGFIFLPVAVLVLFSGWLSDVLYAALDPRVRI